MQRLTLQTMITNMQAWQDDPNVMSVSLGQFTDNFDGTVKCIADFLKDSFRGDESKYRAFLEKARKHDLSRVKQKPKHASGFRKSRESTAVLRDTLISTGVFGAQLSAIDEMFSNALRE